MLLDLVILLQSKERCVFGWVRPYVLLKKFFMKLNVDRDKSVSIYITDNDWFIAVHCQMLNVTSGIFEKDSCNALILYRHASFFLVNCWTSSLSRRCETSSLRLYLAATCRSVVFSCCASCNALPLGSCLDIQRNQDNNGFYTRIRDQSHQTGVSFDWLHEMDRTSTPILGIYFNIYRWVLLLLLLDLLLVWSRHLGRPTSSATVR